ncbi:hypothetical protein [Arcanobacterium ihumii]|uniref:hypothetical protein n=1 Tax=Arcanobacterium ihumii TaxID=2138162 RepID=UPI000F532995|nr:hypothetical protein [Arcanobacterium ihumii]
MLLIAEFLSQLFLTVFDRRIEQKRRRTGASSLPNAVSGVAVRTLAFAVVGTFTTSSRATVTIVVCAFLVSLGEMATLKSWKDGLDDDEVRHAVQETAQLARDTFHGSD